MEKKTNDKPQPVKAKKAKKARKARTNAEKRKRRMAWMCGILALLNIIALLLLFLLPFNCTGTHHKNEGGNDTTVINDTTIIERNITHEEERVSEEVPEDSLDMDQRVEDEGGNTDAFMRFTIAWNQGNNDNADLDAHASEPTGAHIFFRTKGPTRCGGKLDVDMRTERNLRVENIAWPSSNQLADGDYEMGIHNFNNGSFGNCDVKLKVGNKTFMYKVGFFKNSRGAGNIDPRDIKIVAIVTIRNHQVENIQHVMQPVQE